MKLTLTSEKDVQILTASEAINAQDVQVLRAGISKFFKNGKNKIILELKPPQELPQEVLRELALMDLMARELSGRIMIAGVDAEIKAKIESFATPPVIPVHKDRASALNAFYAPPPPEKPLPTSVTATAPVQAPATPAAKEATHAKEMGEVGGLRKRISELETENETLKTNLLDAWIARKELPDVASFQERIKFLEAQVETYLSQQKA